MKDFFRKLFGNGGKGKSPHGLNQDARLSLGSTKDVRPPCRPGDHIQPGDVIRGKYEIQRKLGEGGCGLVYLSYNRNTEEVAAFKTFRDEFLADARVRESFKREALIWVNLEEHPFILSARWIEEISGRLFVWMDFIAPDEQGRSSLRDHLERSGGSLDTNMALCWAIQFCHAMEHANTHGIRCHRDIKPNNILIRRDGTLLVTDFGLATAAESACRARGNHNSSSIMGTGGACGFSVLQTGGKVLCGTPGYMAPEVYRGQKAAIQSDIYSFGLVLWQMVTGNPMPPWPFGFEGHVAKYAERVYRCQISGYLPRVSEPWAPIVRRCLAVNPLERYAQFGAIRQELEWIYRQRTGRTVELPPIGNQAAGYWLNRGASYDALAQYELALRCHDKAIEIDPQCGSAWNNKGISLAALGKHKEAICNYDKALEINPRDAIAWTNKGASLVDLFQYEDALRCHVKALEIDPGYSFAWNNKGSSLAALDRREEALCCYEKALKIDQRSARTWYNRGISLAALGQHKEALCCYDKAIEIDPRYADSWNNKGASLAALGQHEEALHCYDKAIEIDPRCFDAWTNKGNHFHVLNRREEALCCYDKVLDINPFDSVAWYNKAIALNASGRREEALRCYDKALKINPRHKPAWNNKGIILGNLSRHEEALRCYDTALEINPRDATSWNNKGLSLDALGQHKEALCCYDKAIEIDPRYMLAWYNKGMSLGVLGQHEEAVRCYDTALEINPQDASSWNNKGTRLAALGRREEELRCYEKALEINPRDAATWFNKGGTEESLGRNRDAAKSYRQFLVFGLAQFPAQIVKVRERLRKLDET